MNKTTTSIYATAVNIESVDKDTVQVNLENVDLGLLVSEFYIGDILDALAANDQFSEIHDFVVKNLNEDEE